MSVKTEKDIQMMTGNSAAVRAVKSARIDVMPSYPITPQTSIMEGVAELVESGELKCNYLPVEGEHSVMAAAVAAAATGARVFTATSSQGLLYMSEVLHMAAGSRLPMVLVNVNRGVLAPWTLWSDHQDSLSQRDSGWIQLYCGTVQDIYNTVVQAFRITEQINIPVMVCYDGFSLSHCMMPLELPPQEEIDAFLPPISADWRVDVNSPSSLNNVTEADNYAPYRQMLSEDVLEAEEVIRKAAEEFREHTGLWEGDTIEGYRMEDAEVVALAVGSMATEMRNSVDKLRDEGLKIGLLRLRMVRPFPTEDLIRAFPQNATVAVLDRSYAFGHPGGIIESELKGVLFGRRNDLRVVGRVIGIGGTDVSWQRMADVLAEMAKKEACN